MGIWDVCVCSSIDHGRQKVYNDQTTQDEIP